MVLVLPRKMMSIHIKKDGVKGLDIKIKRVNLNNEIFNDIPSRGNASE